MCNLIVSAWFLLTHRQSMLTLLVCYLFTSSAASAAPAGELDPSFGSNGRLTVHLAGDNEGWIVAQQPDGKLVIGGATLSTDNGFLDYAVVRLMPDGSVDDGFGTAGNAIIDFTGSDDVATSIALQPDGKILLAGTSEKGTDPFDFDFSLARLNPDGSPDVTFDDDGLVTLDLGGDDDIIFGMILLTSGEIVVAGTTNTNDDYDAVFARFTSTGMLDATFGSGLIAGTVVVDTNGSQDNLFAITRHSDGGLVGCGLSGPTAFNASDASMLAVRVNSTGTVDTTFGTDGIALVADDTATSAAETCVAMPDGATILAGYGGPVADTNLLLSRITPDGVRDATFGDSGVSSVDLGDEDIIQSIILLDDGMLGATGNTGAIDAVGSPSFPRDMLLARFDASTGLLDPDFGDNGVTIVDFGTGDSPSLADGVGLIQQADGRLIAVGTSFLFTEPAAFGLARIDPAGTGSTGFAGFVVSSDRLIDEASEKVTIAVRRTGGSTGELSVAYMTESDTAQAPGDFTDTSGTVVWATGDMATKTITIPIADDDVDEPAEQFTVVLSNSNGGLAGSVFTVQIAPSDATPPSGHGGGAITAVEFSLLLFIVLSCGFLNRRPSNRGSVNTLSTQPRASGSSARAGIVTSRQHNRCQRS